MMDDDIRKLIIDTANYTAIHASNIAAEKTGIEIEAKVHKIINDRLGANLIPPDEHVTDHKAIQVLREPGAVEGIRYSASLFGRLEDRRTNDKRLAWVDSVSNAWAGDVKTARRAIITGVIVWIAYLLRHAIIDYMTKIGGR